MRDPIKVYMAGKIAKNDWRHDIFNNLRAAGKKEDLVEGNLRYVGPYFISSLHDPGCFHGDNSHGCGADGDGNCYGYDPAWSLEMKPHDGYGRGSEGKSATVRRCIEWMDEADVIFAWIDKPDAYGTLVEIGIASRMGKSIFLAMPLGFEGYRDMWFAWTLADMAIMTADHLQAWDIFCSVAKRLMSKKVAP